MPSQIHQAQQRHICFQRLARIVLATITLLAVNLLLLDVVLNFYNLTGLRAIRELFNIELESSIGNWISSIVYLTVAVSLWGTFALLKTTQRFSLRNLGWLFLSLAFTYLALDDGAAIHERMGTALKQFSNSNRHVDNFQLVHSIVDSFPSYYWQVIFTPIFIVVGVFMLFHLYRELASKKLLFLVVLSFVIFASAQGLDYLEGIKYHFPTLKEYLGISTKTWRHYQKGVEECLEMIGMGLLAYTFLMNLFYRIGTITLSSERVGQENLQGNYSRG